MKDLLDAIGSRWFPTSESLGQASRELWGNMTWRGRKSATAFISDLMENVDTCMKLETLFTEKDQQLTISMS